MTYPIPTAEVLQKVAGLTNRRRVRPVEDETDQLPNVKGTSAINMPQQDVDGGLIPENYDARANQVMEAEAPQENIWSQIGQALASQVNPPQQSEITHANMVEPDQGNMWRKFLDPIPIQEETVPEVAKEPVDYPYSPMRPSIPEGNLPYSPMPQQKQPLELPEPEFHPSSPVPEDFYSDKGEIASKEQKEPLTYVEKGASEEAFSNPSVKSEIEKMFGAPIDLPQVKEMEAVLQKYSDLLDGVETKISAREQALMDKISNRDLSPGQQLAMALALIAPAAIAGLVGGKEGFLLGLGGGAKSMADILGRKEAEVKEAEEALPALALDKASLQKEKIETTGKAQEIKSKIEKSIPNIELRKYLETPGNAYLLDNKLVVDSGNPLLPIDINKVKSLDDIKKFREKALPDLEEAVSSTDNALNLINNLNNLVEYAESQKKGVAYDYIPWWDEAANAAKAFIPAGRDQFVDEQGNTVKLSELWDTYQELLADAYGNATTVKGQGQGAFKTRREHLLKMTPNPFTASALTKGQTQIGTIKGQLNGLKKTMEDNIYRRLEGHSVNTKPLKEKFSENEMSQKLVKSKERSKRAEMAAEQVIQGRK